MSTFLSIGFFALGAILASFAGVLAERAYTGTAWWRGRSHCNACTRALGAPDLIPILSWLFFRGRCRVCRARVPAAYFFLEIALALAFLGAYARIGLALALLPFLLALVMLAAIVLYDLRHMVVPMPFALWFIALAAFYAYFAYPDARALGFVLLTGGVSALLFFLLHVLSRGRLMGLGDAPIVLGLALLAGTYAISGLVLSFWIGGAVGIVILLMRPRGHRMGIEVPFVPFLAAGYLLATFFSWNPFILIGW